MSTIPVLELKDIEKTFGPTVALSNMSVALYPGEVHALVGENGAGKSTIIKVMTGIYQPTHGTVVIDGNPVRLRNSYDARKHGIAAIFQEPMVFPDMDVAENIFISSTEEKPIVNWHSLRKRAKELIAQVGIELDPKRAASSLSVAEQQVVEIARALSQDVRVLIMDEPTAALSVKEADELLHVAKKLAADGVAVVYISHRLEEVFAIADRVTVIRDGAHISTRKVSEVTSESLIADMVGREVGNYYDYVENDVSEKVMLSASGLSVAGVFNDINFELYQGEILCFAGLVGARRTDVALSLFGLLKPTDGEIKINGSLVNVKSPQEAMRHGIAYITEDRRKFGLALSKPIVSNMTLATLGQYSNRFGLLRSQGEVQTAESYRKTLNIRTPDVFVDVGNLSGGNQQKVLLAKWLETKPKVLIVDEPTRGIDIGAKAEVHELIRQFVKDGGAVIVISSDLPEVLALGDRILIMREGRQCGILRNSEATQENVMALATGANQIMEANA